jgi:hypothetical protein
MEPVYVTVKQKRIAKINLQVEMSLDFFVTGQPQEDIQQAVDQTIARLVSSEQILKRVALTEVVHRLANDEEFLIGLIRKITETVDASMLKDANGRICLQGNFSEDGLHFGDMPALDVYVPVSPHLDVCGVSFEVEGNK